MTPIRSILVTTDFSAAAQNAAARAALIAGEHGACLTLLNVVDPSSLKSRCAWLSAAPQLERKLAQARASLQRLTESLTTKHGIGVVPLVRVGDALEQIRVAARDADLLVIGALRTNALRAFVLRTPAERLLRILRLPVLITKRAAVSPYQRGLVALDLGADSRGLVDTAVELAPAASIHLFHALSDRREAKMRAAEVPDALVQRHRENMRSKALRTVRAIVRRSAGRGLTVSLGHGDPWRLSLKKQREISAELMVIGKDGRSLLGEFLLGSVAQRIVSSATCDVLVIPRTASFTPAIGSRPGRTHAA